MGNRVFVCWLSCWVGSYLHLILCFNLPYFLANSSTYLFEKIKNTHYLELFSVAYQKGTSACPIPKNGICSCTFSVFQSGSFSCFSSNFTFTFTWTLLYSDQAVSLCSQSSPFSTPGQILFIWQLHFKFHLSCDASLEHPRSVVPKCLECLYQKNPKNNNKN